MKTERELLDEIGNVLHAYEDAYVPGAWEEFAKRKRNKRGIVFLRIAVAAAMLLILGYVAWLFVPVSPLNNEAHQTKITKQPYSHPKNNQEHNSSTIAQPVVAPKFGADNRVDKLTSGTKAPSVITQAETFENPDEQISVTNKALEPGPTATTASKAGLGIIKKDSTIVTAATLPLDNATAFYNKSTNPPSVVKKETTRFNRETQRLSYDSLANLKSTKPVPADNKKIRNLSYTVLLSPSVGNQKMNFGSGVEVAYNISKKISVSSGISYAYVNAGSNRNNTIPEGTPNYNIQGFNSSKSDPASAVSSYAIPSSSQNIKSVKLALSGLEIPLSFQYKTPGGFYVSAGVSAMSVISNDLSYNVINNSSVTTPSANGLTNTINVVTEETTRRSNENLSGYIGFYTFSAGKKVSFGKGKLNFAPFIKIPFSRVSSENIQLLHGGVQLGIGF